MRIAEPWHDEAALEIDDLGVRTDVGADIIGRADQDKPSILDGECLRQRRAVAGGEHLAVDGYEVCGLGRGLTSGTDAQKRNGGEGGNPMAHDVTPDFWSARGRDPRSASSAARPLIIALFDHVRAAPLFRPHRSSASSLRGAEANGSGLWPAR
jgi:hypothetical protein